jgi:hypothetical protein
MYCLRCGKELAPGAAFCHNCGARVGEYSPVDWRSERWRERWERRRERWERREWDPMDAAWGAIIGVGYLIIIGMTIFYYPDVFTLLTKYFEGWGTHGQPVLPPYALGQVLIFLFTAGGVWGVVSSGLRLGFTTRFERPLRGIVSALFSLYVAFTLNRFYARAFSGAGLVFAFFVGLAVVILVNTMIRHILPIRWAQKQAPPS